MGVVRCGLDNLALEEVAAAEESLKSPLHQAHCGSAELAWMTCAEIAWTARGVSAPGWQPSAAEGLVALAPSPWLNSSRTKFAIGDGDPITIAASLVFLLRLLLPLYLWFTTGICVYHYEIHGIYLVQLTMQGPARMQESACL